MLHDPSHRTPRAVAEKIKLGPAERDVLRRLVGEIAEIAALPEQTERAELWRRLNDLDSARPLVWINEIPWHEMDVEEELTPRTTRPWARDWETRLRRTLYQWRHMPGDMVVSDVMECPLAIRRSDFGIIEDVDVVATDVANPVVSRHFNIQIKEPEDIDRIRMPTVTHNTEATELRLEAMSDVCEGLMPVRRLGQTHIWFTPWDYLIRWWGVTEAMLDLHDRPDMVHAAVDRLVQGWMTELDQFVEQRLLALDCNNTRIGSGGYGYTSALPGEDFDADWVKPHNMWGCSNAQIFSDVSPDTHWEFALKHDIPWLSRWGLNYYGCCEPLDGKLEILRRIPNLRKISMSGWIDVSRAVENVGGDYVFSYKPSPAYLAEHSWRPEAMRDELSTVLEQAEGCHVEVILKDISTVRYEPRRLWEWERLAMELVNA